jgi:hypothetical protein
MSKSIALQKSRFLQRQQFVPKLVPEANDGFEHEPHWGVKTYFALAIGTSAAIAPTLSPTVQYRDEPTPAS